MFPGSDENENDTKRYIIVYLLTNEQQKLQNVPHYLDISELLEQRINCSIVRFRWEVFNDRTEVKSRVQCIASS